jgi:hypothetical protein
MLQSRLHHLSAVDTVLSVRGLSWLARSTGHGWGWGWGAEGQETSRRACFYELFGVGGVLSHPFVLCHRTQYDSIVQSYSRLDSEMIPA